MSSKTEDFPTPVSPKGMVYGAFASLMCCCDPLPFSRLLERLLSRRKYHCDLLYTRGVILIIVFQGVLA